MTIWFLNAKEYSLEWALSLVGIDVVARHEVELHMSEVRMNDLESRKQVFSWKNPVLGFFLEYPSVFIVVIGLLLVLSVFSAVAFFTPAHIDKKNAIAGLLGALVVVGIPFFILRCITPFMAEVNIRQWSKEVPEVDDVDSKIKTIRQLSSEYPMMPSIQIFVYSHPFVTDKWYSVSGVGDSGKQEEYFFLHTTK